MIADGAVAVAVDPQRDVERITAVLDARAWRLGAVVETHVHNDYVTGGLELARHSDAVYVVPAGPSWASTPYGRATGTRSRPGS
ncbi:MULTISPECIES: hypothetical protein [unclassified Streptomyces]|uniref:hypothetical protein n=1 Tax=unclassified Streptomyces TaxID=2593676 RepID=UPI00336AC94F